MLTIMFLFTNSQEMARSEGCPDDPSWLNTGSSCYLVSHDRMSWFESQEFCYEKGGYLTEITSHEEESLLDRILLADLHYWIGLTDFAIEGKWVWQDSHKEAEYHNWAPTQPNSCGHGHDCDCVFKTFTQFHEQPGWADYHCTLDAWGEPIHALCEFDIVLFY